ncbi:MAG: hypothetical protein H6819_08735 [Phycisphaerales bacterium]|nr:hypothetical protein [Phycisphaerales bacterium]MCB9855683.1 hypothetical protein [Phycisphaerales bacterium]MCB9862578.1 hypothetical protein [Phycisphaerales bacterium]
MRKTLCAVAGLAVAFSASLASAQMKGTFFLDARDSIAAINAPTTQSGYANEPNGGGRGDGQTIYIGPKVGTAHIVGPNDTSKATMTLYVDVSNGGASEVLAAVGLDMSIAAPAANERELLAASVTIHNTPASVGGGLTNNPWNDTAVSTAFTTAGGGIKAVRVPVEDLGGGPMFNASLGIQNGLGYRLATVNLEADTCGTAGRGCQANLGVFLSVNNLLVTAVSDPGPSAAMDLELGYTGGAPEAATADGSTQGATSASADAVIAIKPKGDFNDNGVTNGLDLGLVIPTFNMSTGGTANHRQVYTGDYNGDGLFNGLDLGLVIPYFNAVVANCVSCV